MKIQCSACPSKIEWGKVHSNTKSMPVCEACWLKDFTTESLNSVLSAVEKDSLAFWAIPTEKEYFRHTAGEHDVYRDQAVTKLPLGRQR
jgi:hypothetical protein